MKHQLKTAILTAILSLSSILALDITAQALPPVDTTVENSNSSAVPDTDLSEETDTGTQFTCVPKNDGSVVTVGQRPGGQPIPLIIWTAASLKYFGEKYTPQVRCKIVTQKLTDAVAESGGRLKDVVLMTGRIKKNTVVCVVSAKDTGCDDSNILFTLNPKNAKQADKILAQIELISHEGSGDITIETGVRKKVRLKDLLSRKTNRSLGQPRKGLTIKKIPKNFL